MLHYTNLDILVFCHNYSFHSAVPLFLALSTKFSALQVAIQVMQVL